jgi:hypothetical protein
MVRKCGVCRQVVHDRRKCPRNDIPVVPANRGRGGGTVRGRGRGQSPPQAQAQTQFRPASQFRQHIVVLRKELGFQCMLLIGEKCKC